MVGILLDEAGDREPVRRLGRSSRRNVVDRLQTRRGDGPRARRRDRRTRSQVLCGDICGRREDGESFKSLVPLGLMAFPTIGREAITSAIDEEEGGEGCKGGAEGSERCLNLPKNMRGEEEDGGVG